MIRRSTNLVDVTVRPDYVALYEDANVSFERNVIRYVPEGTIDDALIHDGVAYVGIMFPGPETATCATMFVDGIPTIRKVDLTVDGDNVIDGTFIEYFAFADSNGNPLPDKAWVIQMRWYSPTGRTKQTVLIKRKTRHD